MARLVGPMTKIAVASPRGEGVAGVLAGDAVGEDEGGLTVDPVNDAAAQVDLATGVAAVGDRERDARVALDGRGLKREHHGGWSSSTSARADWSGMVTLPGCPWR